MNNSDTYVILLDYLKYHGRKVLRLESRIDSGNEEHMRESEWESQIVTVLLLQEDKTWKECIEHIPELES